ncbi:hypothetical protein HH800_04900 [Sphingobium yanoikuyae]|jgi:hypothetical protein|uniref:Uncharacterized protein n=1 Tax=Sphingobium yanoikuyae TaxID=13690 RepID=A0A6M4G2M3_SPHYA|nr:hypothetical protein [Sphingobium yanoikuyae]QJR01592.1 hypothetical protein HH800_04900 [Sphingobium yanoikuyae]
MDAAAAAYLGSLLVFFDTGCHLDMGFAFSSMLHDYRFRARSMDLPQAGF